MRKIVCVDDDPARRYGLRKVERVVDQRLARDLDHRLWPRLGERAHARAETGGEYHQGVGIVPHASFSLFRWSRVGSGRSDSSWERTPDKAGWARSRSR